MSQTAFSSAPSSPLTVDAAPSVDKSAPPLNGRLSPSAPASAAHASFASPLSSLHSDVYGLFSFLDRLSQQDHSQRRSVLSRLTSVIHALYPAAEVKPIGSCATELFLPDSDMDLLVRHPARLPPLTISDLHAVGSALEPVCSSLQIISTASVPLIKLTTDTITVDITLNVDTGHHSTRLVQSYIDRYPLLRPLVLIIKQLLKARGLNDLYSGGLPSYTLILMVVSMLQRDEQGMLDTVALSDPARHQPAEEKQEDELPAAGLHKDSHSSGGSTTPRASAADSSLSPLTFSPDLGLYLLSFLRLYGYVFDYGNMGICVRPPGHCFLKAQRQWLHPHNPQLLSVENPLDPSIDLGFKVFNIGEIVAYFKEAYQQLTREQPMPIRTAAEWAENESELHAGGGVHDVEEVKEFRPMPLLSTVTSAVTDVTMRSPSPQHLPSALFDRLRTSSAPAHPLQFSMSATASTFSSPAPSSASSSASSQQTPSRASTTSPASPSMKQSTAAPNNGYHYPPTALTSHAQSAVFYPNSLYASPAAHPPAAATAAAGNPSPSSSAASTSGVCMCPCCFPPSHVLVYDRQGHLVYIPASFANQLQQANAAQLASNAATYAHYSQSTTNSAVHPQPQHSQQQHSHQHTTYIPPSSPTSAGAGNPNHSPHVQHQSLGSPHTSHGGNGGTNKPNVNSNGHNSAHTSHSRSPQQPSPGTQRDRGKGGRGGGGGKGKREIHHGAANGYTTQVEQNGNANGSQWQRQ